MAKNKFQKIVSSIGTAMAKFFTLAKFEKVDDKSAQDATTKRTNNMKRVAVLISLLILVLIIIILRFIIRFWIYICCCVAVKREIIRRARSISPETS